VTLGGKIVAIEGYLPEKILSNDDLARLYPSWPPEKILGKTGILNRRIAAENETAVDLACAAAFDLFAGGRAKPTDIDYLIFCSQTPDYILPTSACVIQHRLGLRTDIGALDINLGCSGFVYGLSLAQALIATGVARRVLLLTADTYSKVIHPLDRGVRSLFGDGAAATLIEAIDSDELCLGPFVLGTDGAGAQNLIVPAGGFRQPRSVETARVLEDASGNQRSLDDLYMDGAAIMGFTLGAVPAAIEKLLARTGKSMADFDAFVLHQASAFILNRLRQKLAIPAEKFVVALRDCGNTVSSTIPLALAPLLQDGRPRRVMLVGFGVGYSWAATQALIGDK
jgi:3-oxoacyl-[acyl-carrier-protein] synthase-3